MKKNTVRISPLDSPAFRRWFGDSVVVDEDGEPLVVYHSAKASFDLFDFDRADDLGMHFGTREQAEEAVEAVRERGIVRPFYLRLERPLRLRDPGDWIAPEGATMAPPVPTQLAELGLINSESEDALLEPLYDAPRTWDYGSSEKRSVLSRMLRDTIVDLGFDGVVYKNTFEGNATGDDSFIAFSPEQIKIADGTNTTFDPENPDVRKNPGRTYTPPEMVAAEAEYGLHLRAQQPPSNRCCTAVGLARAKQLKNREPVSVDTLKRMRSYFQRHAVDKRSPRWALDSKGFQAWLLWGGDSGRDWCNRILDGLGE